MGRRTCSIIIPTLGRPYLLRAQVEAFCDTTYARNGFEIIYVVDVDDKDSLYEVASLREDFGAVVGIVALDGSPAKRTLSVKTNRGVDFATGEWLLLTDDDVIPHKDWLGAALRHDRADVIGCNDLSPQEDPPRVTQTLVRASYVDDPGAAWGEPGVAFHEGYWHNFVETELWELACHRGVAVYESESIIEHHHPDWGKADEDDTYRVGARRGWDKDMALFNQRQEAWRQS